MKRTALLLAACMLAGSGIGRAQEKVSESVAPAGAPAPLPPAKELAPVPATATPAPCASCDCAPVCKGKFRGDRGHLLHHKPKCEKRCVACYIDCATLPGRCCCQSTSCFQKMWSWISYCPAQPKEACQCCICPLFACTHRPTAQYVGIPEAPVNVVYGSGVTVPPSAPPSPPEPPLPQH